jgi:hypothetical protein
MYTTSVPSNVRRAAPRIELEAFCSEILEGRERHAVVLDLSPRGLRLARPYTGGRGERDVQLELELPGVDEIIWAKGHICYERIRPSGPATMPLGRLVRTTGIRLVAAAERDLRVLREYVMMRRQGPPPLPVA